jgi:hypothetical protein
VLKVLLARSIFVAKIPEIGSFLTPCPFRNSRRFSGGKFSCVVSQEQDAEIYITNRKHSSTGNSLVFQKQVVQWLDSENIPWQEASPPLDFPAASNENKDERKSIAMCSNAILELRRETSDTSTAVWLHVIPTPSTIEEVAAPHLNKRMTDYVDYKKVLSTDNSRNETLSNNAPTRIIHLHQDVWLAKTDIVKSRILAQVGRTQRRLFARKTIGRRINATYAMDFLHQHHLWDATRAKYYYGLFLSAGKYGDGPNDELVAVATFSNRRKILRYNQTHSSHELLRFCTQRDMNVVGGISKLIKLFVNEQQPDDIVTVIDRDWGSGSGWNSFGFERVALMPPLPMVVNQEELGTRRHLVGAGIVHEEIPSTHNNGRSGLPMKLMNELEATNSTNDEAIDLLANHSYHIVHDSGVERMMKIVSNSNKRSAKELWNRSTPTYATSYYSRNSAIASILRNSESRLLPPLDSTQDRECAASWRNSGTHHSAQLVFAAPSSLDPKATVEVRERQHGWRTVGISGGIRKSIFHAIYKVDTSTEKVVPAAVVSETYKTMSAVAMTSLSLIRPSIPSTISASSPFNFLHFGYGAGTLARLLAHQVTISQHECIEVDEGVVKASQQCIATDLTNIHVQVGDALAYVRAQSNGEKRYDCVCIDVIDEHLMVPKEVHTPEFLSSIYNNVLEDSGGIVVHNFHSGNEKRALQLREAKAAYSKIFDSCYMVDALDSRPNAGNVILLAIKGDMKGTDIDGALSHAALGSQIRWGFQFDFQCRVSKHHRSLSCEENIDCSAP